MYQIKPYNRPQNKGHRRAFQTWKLKGGSWSWTAIFPQRAHSEVERWPVTDCYPAERARLEVPCYFGESTVKTKRRLWQGPYEQERSGWSRWAPKHPWDLKPVRPGFEVQVSVRKQGSGGWTSNLCVWGEVVPRVCRLMQRSTGKLNRSPTPPCESWTT